MSTYAGRVLIYGGKGALGSTIVKYFIDRSWWAASIDLVPNTEASANVVLESSESWTEQDFIVNAKVAEVIGSEKVDAILCVAGGWAGGNAASSDLVKNSDMMWKQSVWTSVIASGLAAKYLKDGGVLVLTGAQAALTGTAGMIGYGLAKAAVHQLVNSLSQANSGLPPGAFVTAILPITLDTPMNRKFMPSADFSTWTSLDTVAELLYKWADKKERPANGSLIQLITKDNKTNLVI